MCGIVGIYNTTNPRIARQTAGVMADTLCRRGPDNGNVEAIGNTVFAHRRLSIIDLDKRSDQPMISGHAMITFNGEIYRI